MTTPHKMNKRIIGTMLVLMILTTQLVSGLPYRYNTTFSLTGNSYRNLSCYQITSPLNNTEIGYGIGYPVFTYATVDEPHYDNIFNTCMLPGDMDVIWIKVPEIPKEGIQLRIWYNGIIPNPVNVDNDCSKVFEYYNDFNQSYIAVRKWSDTTYIGDWKTPTRAGDP